MEITLSRNPDDQHGTTGIWRVGGFTCMTLERPWLSNRPNISCIPPGRYRLRRGIFGAASNRKNQYPALEVLDVPGRTVIWLHGFNIYTQSKGCIGPGRSLIFDELKNSMRVTASRSTLVRILEEIEGVEELWLNIG